MGAVAAAALAIADMSVPQIHYIADLESFLGKVEFPQHCADGMLSFLLFAGALHVDISKIAHVRWPVIVLSTLGVLASMFIVGGGLHVISGWLGISVPLIACMTFGALSQPDRSRRRARDSERPRRA